MKGAPVCLSHLVLAPCSCVRPCRLFSAAEGVKKVLRSRIHHLMWRQVVFIQEWNIKTIAPRPSKCVFLNLQKAPTVLERQGRRKSNAKRHYRQRFRRLCIGFGQSPTFFVTPLLCQNCPNCGFGHYSGWLFLQPSFSTPRTSCFRAPLLRQSLLIICFCSPHDLQKKLVLTPIASNKNAQI